MFPVAVPRVVNDESAIGLHRAPLHDRLLSQRARIQGHLELFEDIRKPHVQWPIDDDAERALFVVLPNIGDRLGEVRVRHRRHGDQKLIGEEIRAGHAASIGRNPGSTQAIWRLSVGEITESRRAASLCWSLHYIAWTAFQELPFISKAQLGILLAKICREGIERRGEPQD